VDQSWKVQQASAPKGSRRGVDRNRIEHSEKGVCVVGGSARRCAGELRRVRLERYESSFTDLQGCQDIFT